MSQTPDNEQLQNDEFIEDIDEQEKEYSEEESCSPKVPSESAIAVTQQPTDAITKASQLKYEPSDEPYDSRLCTINIAIQLHPEVGQQRGRSVLLGVRSHGDSPIIQFCNLNEIALPQQILQLIDKLTEQFPEKEKLRTERNKAAQEAAAAKETQKGKVAEAKSKDKGKKKSPNASQTHPKQPTASTSAKREPAKNRGIQHEPIINAEQLFLFS